MRRLFSEILICMSFTLAPAILGAQAACRPVESKVDAVRKQFVEIVTATDTKTVALRQSLNLPSAVSGDVVVVTDTTVCQSAANAIAHAVTTDPNPTVYPVWVLKIGTSRYVVFSPEYNDSGEFSDYTIFDDSFNYLATLAS